MINKYLKHEVMSVFPLIRNKKVLDIGGATGFNFEYIKDNVSIYKEVTLGSGGRANTTKQLEKWTFLIIWNR